MGKLITPAEVVEIAFNRKLSDKKIQDSLIETAQYKYIRPILGEDLYEAITADVNATTYEAITGYIKQALAWWTKYLALPELFVEIADTGVKQLQSQNSANVSDQRFMEVRENTRIVAEDKTKQLTEQLYDSDLTDYYHGNNPDAAVTIAGGIIFENRDTVDLTEDNDPYNDDL